VREGTSLNSMKTIKRRIRESKTDYSKRIKLLKGNTPRIVFRKTNKYVIAQYVTSREAQDKVEISVTSKKLMEYGWPENARGSLKSIPAAYLTGFLIGKNIVKSKMKDAIIDFGMIRNVHKSRSYAFLKGLIDAGLKIKCEKDLFPDENRIRGKHMKKDFTEAFNQIKSKLEKE